MSYYCIHAHTLCTTLAIEIDTVLSTFSLPGMLVDVVALGVADGGTKILVVAALPLYCFFPIEPGRGLTLTSVVVVVPKI